MLLVKRGNIQRELSEIGEEESEGTEIQNITMFKLMRAFEKAMQKYSDRINKPTHTVVQYNYTMEGSRDQMLTLAREQKTVPFDKIFDACENRVHAIFLFLSLLELVQQKFLKIIIGTGKNNFIIEYNDPEMRLAELEDQNPVRPGHPGGQTH
jgi:segregation and condensation protein A